jgi:glycosyltransferase involved in cell wall biosynthesis
MCWARDDYYNWLMPTIRKYQQQGHWHLLGVLSPEEMAAFYPNLDVLVVPSLNSTEAFGLVQIEAMMNGTPCVASALPGVRQPVLTTGMGKVVPIGDANALASAILDILDRPAEYRKDPRRLRADSPRKRSLLSTSGCLKNSARKRRADPHG